MTKGTQFLMTSAFAALVGFPAVAQEAALANVTCAAFAALDDDTRANALTQIGEVYMADTAETEGVNTQVAPAEGADMSVEPTGEAGATADATTDTEAATNEAMTQEGAEMTADPTADPPEDAAAAEPETTDGAAAADGEASGDVAADAELSAQIAAACEGNDDATVLSVLEDPTN